MSEFVKSNDGRYEGIHGTTKQYSVTQDEALYAFHACQWLHTPSQERITQQVHSRRIENGKPQYLMGWDFRWYDESVLEAIQSLV